MGELKVKDKDIVVPGEILAVGMDYLPAGGAFRENDSIIASQIGIVSIEGRLIKLVAINWRYIPKKGDTVIGRITEVGLNNWFVDVNHTHEAILLLREGSSSYIPKDADLSHYYNYEDYIVANITKISRGRQPELTMKGPGLRKLTNGRIIKVNPAKVPRIIGKQGSMVSMIKQMTECRIIAGQNGIIWVSGFDPEKERIAVKVIKMVEEKAHKQGLTDQIKSFLEKELGVKLEVKLGVENDVQQEK